GESANIVTGLFKDGLCTVRGAANRWRNFTRDISGAFVSLFSSTNEALLPGLSPEQQPVVTVIDSTDKNIPAGSRMTLIFQRKYAFLLFRTEMGGAQPAQSIKKSTFSFDICAISHVCIHTKSKKR
ncbi:MAG: hypothetical protein K2P04_10195, partial [Oscillospiraceae bacterium]|nr:hypothetical protein [Oscillospiraceae bacterium]